MFPHYTFFNKAKTFYQPLRWLVVAAYEGFYTIQVHLFKAINKDRTHGFLHITLTLYLIIEHIVTYLRAAVHGHPGVVATFAYHIAILLIDEQEVAEGAVMHGQSRIEFGTLGMQLFITAVGHEAFYVIIG